MLKQKWLFEKLNKSLFVHSAEYFFSNLKLEYMIDSVDHF